MNGGLVMALHSDRTVKTPLGGFGIHARVADEWLELSASVGALSVRPALAWPLLRFNASLTGPMRLALAPGAGTIDLRAEIWIEDEVDVEARAAALGHDMRSALSALRDANHVEQSRGAAPIESCGPASSGTDRLVHLCAEAGWPCVERGSGRVTVEIDTGFSSYHARLEHTAGGSVSAIVDLVDAPASPPAPRAAIGLLLLTTAAAVRVVKGVVMTHDEGERAGLAVTCEGAGSSDALDRALSALTVACRLAGREAQALRHEAIALEYLAWRAPAPPDAPAEVAVYNHRTMKENTCLQQP